MRRGLSCVALLSLLSSQTEASSHGRLFVPSPDSRHHRRVLLGPLPAESVALRPFMVTSVVTTTLYEPSTMASSAPASAPIAPTTPPSVPPPALAPPPPMIAFSLDPPATPTLAFSLAPAPTPALAFSLAPVVPLVVASSRSSSARSTATATSNSTLPFGPAPSARLAGPGVKLSKQPTSCESPQRRSVSTQLTLNGVTGLVLSAKAPTREPDPGCVPAPVSGPAETRDICTAPRYCDPVLLLQDTGVWTGAAGSVMQNEVESALSQLFQVPAFEDEGAGNGLANGPFGQAALAAAFLFETTTDIRVLDQAVRMADNILHLRNDPQEGRVMWTGNRELIWPTKPEDGATAGYAGSEQLDIVAHMLQPAIYILKTPCLWEKTPQSSTGPSPFASNTTYLARALAYVYAADQTYDTYIKPWFFQADGTIQQPDDPRWNDLQDLKAGSAMPWNRRFLMLHGMLKMATVHSVQGVTYAPDRVAALERLITINVRQFVAALVPSASARDGIATYIWSYTPVAGVGSIEQVYGIHSFYDTFGLFLAWQRGLASDVLTIDVLTTLAATFVHQLWWPAQRRFADYVDGSTASCDQERGVMRRVQTAWALYARFLPEVYNITVQTNADSLSNAFAAAPLLFVKAARNNGSDAFWRGPYQ